MAAPAGRSPSWASSAVNGSVFSPTVTAALGAFPGVHADLYTALSGHFGVSPGCDPNVRRCTPGAVSAGSPVVCRCCGGHRCWLVVGRRR